MNASSRSYYKLHAEPQNIPSSSPPCLLLPYVGHSKPPSTLHPTAAASAPPSNPALTRHALLSHHFKSASTPPGAAGDVNIKQEVKEGSLPGQCNNGAYVDSTSNNFNGGHHTGGGNSRLAAAAAGFGGGSNNQNFMSNESPFGFQEELINGTKTLLHPTSQPSFSLSLAPLSPMTSGVMFNK